jgi:hypothetical protein
MIQAIAGTLVFSAALLLFGWYVAGVSARQQSPRTTGAQALSEATELHMALSNDNGTVQNALRSGTAQTFAVAGGGSVTISASGNNATIAAPDGVAQVSLLAKGGGD